MENPRIWRIRISFDGSRKDLAKAAWENNKVGIWYGGWNAVEFEEALQKPPYKEQKDWLSETPNQRQLWGELTWPQFNTCLRFVQIDSKDWVYLYFDGALHFARLEGPLQTAQGDQFNLKNPSYLDGPPELFKYREITEKKAFRLGQLPTSFLILRSAGRGNVYEHRDSYQHLVKILAECLNESEVCERFRKLSVGEWLGWIDDKTWEAICEAYLILERDFVPVGLKVGGTLADLDIVGYSRDGTRILAQCKKHPRAVSTEAGFLSLCSTFPNPKELYYFAYGGIRDGGTDIKVIDGNFITGWLNNEPKGKVFRKLLGFA